MKICYNETANRIKRLLEAANVESIIISSAGNLFYYSGYENCEAKLVATKNGVYYITDSRYTEEARNAIPDSFEIVNMRSVEAIDCIKSLVGLSGLVGIDESGLLHSDYATLANYFCEYRLVAVDNHIAAQRSIKSEYEQTLMGNAAAIADEAYTQWLSSIRLGATEKELAAELDYLMRKGGADDTSFKTIVAFGENSSKPHAHPSERRLNRGDVVLADFGAKKEGYCSDMTRCVIVGEATDSQLQTYNRVLTANELGISLLVSDVSASSIHQSVVEYFKGFEQDSFFIHSLGHGVGVDIHENPYLGGRSKERLKEGMIATIEPGLYFPDKFGIRIEDMLVVGKEGAKPLNHTNKNLIII